MSRFSSLLNPATVDPADRQRIARTGFSAEVSSSKLHLRNPHDPVPDHGMHLILGIATYSSSELELLDILNASLESHGEGAESVEVFDVLDCKAASDFEKFIPGMNTVYQTPVLGLVKNGRVVERVTGFDGVKKALSKLQLLDGSTATSGS